MGNTLQTSQGKYLDECLACAHNEVPKGTRASDTQSLAFNLEFHFESVFNLE